jgi:hypothetical protein
MYIYNSQISIYHQIANDCFGDSHLLPTLQMHANQCWSMCDLQRLSRTTFLHLSVPLSSERQLNCWATWFVLLIGCCILAWDSCEFHTKQWEGGFLCSCRLLAPRFSAIDSLQECSSLFEEPKGGAAFTGYAAGRPLCTYPYFDCCFYFSNLFAVLAGHLCEFHTEHWVECCSVPVSCLPHAFLQCWGAVHLIRLPTSEQSPTW